ncbi:MAG: hypothetical protein R3C05_18465 [Pirellulaceae bacterium]
MPWSRALLLAMWVACLAPFSSIGAQDDAWIVERARLPAKPRQARFVLTCSTPERAANGYMPVYLDFHSNAKVFPADRTITVRLSPRTESTTDLDFDFQVVCRLVQGTSHRRFIAYVPYYTPWNHLRIEMSEEGATIDGGSTVAGFDGLASRHADQHVTIGIMATPRKPAGNAVNLPDVRTLVTVFGEGPISEDLIDGKEAVERSSASPLDVQPAWVQFRMLPISPQAAHPSWLGYSQLDFIVAKASDLQGLLGDDTARQALTDWIAAGGSLFVYDGAGFVASELGVMLKVASPNDVPDGREVRQRLALHETNDPSKLEVEYYGDVYKESRDWQFNSDGKDLRPRSIVFEELVTAKHPIVDIEPKNDIASRIKHARLGWGSVTVVDDPHPFPGSFQFWQAIDKLYTDNRLQWVARHGIDVRKGNDYYWAWLIKAVGGPPVKTFFLINTLFVLVIGPLGYLFFRRRERLYLLLFAAPALATLLTLGLFLYALTADGWRTRVRARQITWQDADAGYLVDHGRQAYFSGLGSSDGIKVSETTAVYPLSYQSITHDYTSPKYKNSRRTIFVDDQGYRFSDRFLPARSQVQYLMLQPRRATPLVTFHHGSAKLSVVNRSEHGLECVVASDDKQRIWFARDVPSGGEAEMSIATDTSIKSLLQVESLDYPKFVPTLDKVWARYNTGIEISLPERTLNAWLGRLPADSFIATTELQSDLIGVDGAVTDGSVRVIMGATR